MLETVVGKKPSLDYPPRTRYIYREATSTDRHTDMDIACRTRLSKLQSNHNRRTPQSLLLIESAYVTMKEPVKKGAKIKKGEKLAWDTLPTTL